MKTINNIRCFTEKEICKKLKIPKGRIETEIYYQSARIIGLTYMTDPIDIKHRYYFPVKSYRYWRAMKRAGYFWRTEQERK